MADHVNPCARGHWRPVELTGWLLPWRNGQPVLIELPGAPASAVPVFDAPEDLRRCMADVGVTNYTIKQVTDGIDFAASVEEGGAIVAANPRPTGQGTTAWTWVIISAGAAPGLARRGTGRGGHA